MTRVFERLLLISTFSLISATVAPAQIPGLSGPDSPAVEPSIGAVSPSLPVAAPKKFSSALDVELQTLGMLTSAYIDLIPGEEVHRILPSTGREPVLASPFQVKTSPAKGLAVRTSTRGLSDPTLARQFSSDSSVESIAAWYRTQYGFDFTFRNIPISDPVAGGTMTVARAVKKIDNTVISVIIWNPTMTRAAKRSRSALYAPATSVAVQERSFRPRDILVPEGPDAVVELTWKVPYRELIQKVSAKYQIDPFLIAALVQQESGFNATAMSVDSAMGLTQMIPGTADMMGVSDPTNPNQSLDGGVRYLKLMLQKFNGNVMFALAAYNAGPGNVIKYKGIPPFAETRDYVKRIMARYTEKAGGGRILAGAKS